MAQRSGVPKHAEKLCHIYHKRLAKGSFASILGSPDSNLQTLTKTGSSFQFFLPERLTMNKVLTVSSALAIFDDLSTVGFMGADTCNRPGVSVHLETELLRSVPSGTDLTLNCKIDKIGKTMGFTSMELVLTSSPNVIVARGKHVKFLPLGSWIMDSVILQPAVLKPLITHFLYDDGTDLFSKIGLSRPFVRPINWDPQVNAYAAIGLSPVPSAPTQMQTTVHQALCNPMGSMHGGAVAMAAELATTKVARPDGLDPSSVAVEMQLTYLSALTGPIIVDVSPDPIGRFEFSKSSHGLLRRANSSAPAVQFSCRFGKVAK